MGKLEELDYDHTVHEDRYKQDHRLMVRFFTDVLPDEKATKEAGHKKFRDAVFIQIVVPGDRRQVTIREARPDDIARFREKYDRFMANHEVEVDGYPISQWPVISRSQAEELRYLGFHTVENLAHASEQALTKYPGLRALQQRAAAFIEAQTRTAPIEKMQTQIDDLAQQNAALMAQLQMFMKEAGKTPTGVMAVAAIEAGQHDHDPVDLGETG